MNPMQIPAGKFSVAWQRGIGLPAAIFVITLMAAIAVAVNALLSQNAQTFEEELSLTRAFFAAESGAGFAMNTIYPPEEFPAYNVTAECAAGPRVYQLTVPGLNACTATVTCNQVTIGSDTFATIESEGECDGVERTIQVRTAF